MSNSFFLDTNGLNIDETLLKRWGESLDTDVLIVYTVLRARILKCNCQSVLRILMLSEDPLIWFTSNITRSLLAKAVVYIRLTEIEIEQLKIFMRKLGCTNVDIALFEAFMMNP